MRSFICFAVFSGMGLFSIAGWITKELRGHE